MILTVTIECDVECPDGFDEFLIQDALDAEVESAIGRISSISVEDDSDEADPWKNFDVQVKVT